MPRPQKEKKRELAATAEQSARNRTKNGNTSSSTSQDDRTANRKHADSSKSTSDNPARPKIQKRRLSPARQRKPTLSDQLHRALHTFYDWKNEHHYLGRYSVEKLLAFEDYQRTTNLLRVIAVVVLTPLPSLFVMFALAAIPLQNPLLGASENVACFVQSACAYTFMSFRLLIFMRQSLGWTDEIYSLRDALVISALTAATSECFMAMVASTWWFPVPFRDLIGSCSYFVWFPLYHIALVGKKLRANKQKLIEYMPLFVCEASTLFIFEAIAIVFKNVSAESQVVLTLCFPVVKALLKRMIWYYAHRLDDISTDVTICVVEIFGSLFQNICIQNVRSLRVSALMVVIGFLQATLETKMYLSHTFIVDGKVAIPTAVKIVESALFPSIARGNQDFQYARGAAAAMRPRASSTNNPHTKWQQAYAGATFLGPLRKSSSVVLAPRGSNTTLSFLRTKSRIKIAAVTSESMFDLRQVDIDPPPQQAGPDDIADDHNPEQNPDGSDLPGKNAKSAPTAVGRQNINVDDISRDHKELATLLTQTLQLLFASEVLVFIEYAEMVVSVLYGLYSLVLYHLPYAKYNLAFLGMSASDFEAAILITAVYSALECVSMLLMFYLVRVKYGLSALYQLAFVLENYTLSIQGKILGSLVLIFNLNTVHHGVDLSFEFNWEKVLNGTSGL